MMSLEFMVDFSLILMGLFATFGMGFMWGCIYMGEKVEEMK